MLSQNKVFDEFIIDWRTIVNKKEFGSKGFQVTTKKLTPKLSKELPPLKKDKQFNNPEKNIMWDLKIKKFYLTCRATFEFKLFDGVVLDLFREMNNVFLWSQQMNEPYRLNHIKTLKIDLNGKPYETALPMLQHLETNEEASIETHVKYLQWITEYYGGIKRGGIPDSRFVNRWKEYISENLDRFKGAMEIKHGEKHRNVCKMRSEMTQKFMSLFPSYPLKDTLKLWCSRLATQLILIHYGEYKLLYVNKKGENYKKDSKDYQFIDPTITNKAVLLPTRASDLSRDFKKRFGVTNEEIEKWKIEVREQKPYKRSHSKGGSKKYR
tara:strand:+ start:2475 stop:3446 length:972 start_codon:yes stop_codon:yes gene_type:complete